MDGQPEAQARAPRGAGLDPRITGFVAAHAPAENAAAAIDAIAGALSGEPMALVALFVSSSADLDAVARAASGAFGEAHVIGCTTAGEISEGGYAENEIVAVGLPASHFAARVCFVSDLAAFRRAAATESAAALRADLAREAPRWTDEFAFLMVDGMSMREEPLVAALGAALGSMPLFGGSAGDALIFGRAYVLHEGRFHTDAAVLALVRTACRVKVFNFDNLRPTARKMVVTRADPERRLVREINAEPAAREYARILGLDPDQLSPLIFSEHPVMVSVGGRHHVRAIGRMEPNGDLAFFSAIDEGLVLTLAEPMDAEANLREALAALSEDGAPAGVLACDCVLRRVAAERSQTARAISDILSAGKVVGFNTFGEQFNSVHVNQTLTGVAIYAPDGPVPPRRDLR